MECHICNLYTPETGCNHYKPELKNNNMKTTKKVISKKTKPVQGKKLQEVVYITEAGKNQKGKKIYHSQTKHEAV